MRYVGSTTTQFLEVQRELNSARKMEAFTTVMSVMLARMMRYVLYQIAHMKTPTLLSYCRENGVWWPEMGVRKLTPRAI